MLGAIERRRSIRQYTEQDVTDQHVKTLLEAAMCAPSGRGLDPWEFVVVRDREVRGQLARLHQYSGMAASAPVVIVVCGDDTVSEQCVPDCSAATENLLLQATEMGLGAVWVAVYPKPEREEPVKKLLGIPPRLRVLCMIPVGHPAEQKPSRNRFNPAKVHQERF